MPKRKASSAIDIRANILEGIFADTFTDSYDVASLDDLEDDANIALPDIAVRKPTLSVKRDELYKRFQSRISPNKVLDRTLVSNQANKNLPFYGWFKYKEGFSMVARLVKTQK